MTEISRGFLESKDRLTDRQYAAIGRVAVLWSEAEWALERILERLVLAPSLLGYVLTEKLGPDNRIAAIRSLINVHKIKYHSKLISEELLLAIRGYLPSLARMKRDRNHIVHSVWANAGEDHLSRFDISETARSGMDFSAGPCDRITDLEEFGKEIEKAANLLWQLGTRIPILDATLLEKLHEQERHNRRLPYAQSTRQFQRRSYERLKLAEPDLPAQPEKSGEA